LDDTHSRKARQTGIIPRQPRVPSKHLGQIGRPQHFVINSSGSSTFGGNDDEHARHSVVLRSSIVFVSKRSWEMIVDARDGIGASVGRLVIRIWSVGRMEITKPGPVSNHLVGTQARESGSTLSGDICPCCMVVHLVYSSFEQTRKKRHPKNHRSRGRK